MKLENIDKLKWNELTIVLSSRYSIFPARNGSHWN
jgi:hypothetical protein